MNTNQGSSPNPDDQVHFMEYQGISADDFDLKKFENAVGGQNLHLEAILYHQDDKSMLFKSS